MPTAPGQQAIEREFFPGPPRPYSRDTLLPGSYHSAMSYPAYGGYPPAQLVDYDDLLPEFEDGMRGTTLWNNRPVVKDQSDFTSVVVKEPTQLAQDILWGEASPVAGPEYAGPYPRTNSVPFPGMFMRGTSPSGDGGRQLTPDQLRVASRVLEVWGMLAAYQDRVLSEGGEPWKTEIVEAAQTVGQALTDVDDATFSEELEASLLESGYDTSQIALYFAFIAGIRQAGADSGLDVTLHEAVGSLGGAVLIGSQEDMQERFYRMSDAQLEYWDRWVDNMEAYLSGTMVEVTEEPTGIPTWAVAAGAAAALFLLG